MPRATGLTKIAQRIAAGNKPHPKTHAELWACCLLFDADDLLMDTMGDDEATCARFDALPEHPCDEDFEITRYALLGPVFGLPKEPPPKKRIVQASSSSRPTADTRAQRAQAKFDAMVNNESPGAIGADRLSRRCRETVQLYGSRGVGRRRRRTTTE